MESEGFISQLGKEQYAQSLAQSQQGIAGCQNAELTAAQHLEQARRSIEAALRIIGRVK